MPKTSIILASTSPRRKELLSRLDLPFCVEPSHIEEPEFEQGDPITYAKDLAASKCAEVAHRFPGQLVIGADTIVVVDDHVLGKPRDPDQAREMLHLLSNRWHEVVTAYAIMIEDKDFKLVTHVSTQVHFKDLSAGDIDRYIASGSPFDKAGAYGIQDGSAIFVDQIQGCFYNVVGFPLADFHTQLVALTKALDLELV